jgi:hypothetical protein
MGFGWLMGFIEHLWIVTASNYSAITNSHTLQFTTRCLVTEPLLPCSRPYWLTTVPQLIHCSNWLNSQAGGHLSPTSYSSNCSLKTLSNQVKVTLWLTVSQSVSLGVKPHLGLMTRYLLPFDSYGLVFVGRPLWREDGSAFCICCWPLPVQSFSVRIPWYSGPYFTVSDLRLPFSSPLMTRRVTVEAFDPSSTRVFTDSLSNGSWQQLFCCCMHVCFAHYLVMVVVYRAIT